MDDARPLPMLDKLGICQWFHYRADADLERAVKLLRELGVRHVRTGVSWADFHRPGGKRWYDRQMQALSEFEILLSVWHTPPSRAEGSGCANPPLRLDDYADFIIQLIEEYGDCFSTLELWNEPNNRMKWNFPDCDPKWRKFGYMVKEAGRRARAAGKPAILGGMIPVDHHWLRLMASYGVLDEVDAISIHAFPGMWWDNHPNWDWHAHWQGWDRKIAYIGEHAAGRPVWVTETGLATWDLDRGVRGRERQQVERLRTAALAPVDRLYWYSLMDLDPRRPAIEGYHVDENEYHLGLVTYEGMKKPAWRTFRELIDRSAHGQAR